MKSGVSPLGLVAGRSRRLTLLLFALMAMFAAAPAAALAGTGTISGAARDANTNNPVAGVAVQAYDSSQNPITATGATATTAADGTYTLTVPTTATSQNFYVGFSKTAYNPNFYANKQTLATADPIPLVNAGAATGIDASLTPTPGTITGSVTDAITTNGVPNVPVQVFDSSGSSFIASGTTAADGSFSITNPSLTEGQYKVFFGASQIGDYNDIWYLSKPQAAQADLVTVHGGQTTQNINQPIRQISGHITGRVTNAAGTPVAGVSVTASSQNGENSATTGPDGTYTITDLATGDYTVSFNPPPSQNLVANYYNNATGPSSATKVHVTISQTTSGINSTLQTGGIVSGTITKAADGTPISGAFVSVLNSAGSQVRSGVTAANGQYSLSGLATGTYFVFARPPASVNVAGQFFGGGSDLGSAQPVNVTAGQTTGSINVALPNAGQISGKVTDSAGNAVAGATIILRDTSGSSFSEDGAFTAADGTYTLKQVPSGTFTVEVIPNSSTLATTYYTSAPNARQATGVPVAPGQAVSGINVTLPGGAGLSGKVTLASSGAPVGGVSVSVLDASGSYIAGTETGSDGSYTLTDVFPGPVKVLFSTATGLGFQYYNNATTLASAATVTLVSGQTAPNINAALSPGGTVTGTVTDASTHATVPNVAVTLLDDQGNAAGMGGFTGPDGKYTIYGVAPGTYFVRFTDESGHRPPYRVQFLGGAVQQAGSNKITVAAGQTTAGVDAALVPQNAPAPGGTVTPPPPVINPGPPTIKGTSLTGVKKRHPKMVFSVNGGSGGASARVESLEIKLPKGLSFKKTGLAKGLRFTGGRGATTLKGNALLIAFQRPTAATTVTLGDKLLAATKAFVNSVKKKKLKTLSIPIEVDNAGGTPFQLKLAFKNIS